MQLEQIQAEGASCRCQRSCVTTPSSASAASSSSPSTKTGVIQRRTATSDADGPYDTGGGAYFTWSNIADRPVPHLPGHDPREGQPSSAGRSNGTTHFCSMPVQAPISTADRILLQNRGTFEGHDGARNDRRAHDARRSDPGLLKAWGRATGESWVAGRPLPRDTKPPKGQAWANRSCSGTQTRRGPQPDTPHTALFTPLLAEHYNVAISAFYGLEGAPLRWKLPRVPGLGGDFGNNSFRSTPRGSSAGPRAGSWSRCATCGPLDPKMAAGLNMVCWCPVDHEPARPQLRQLLRRLRRRPGRDEPVR